MCVLLPVQLAHLALSLIVLGRHNADMEKNMRQTHGTKKMAHDAKCKFGKRKDKSCCPEQKKVRTGAAGPGMAFVQG